MSSNLRPTIKGFANYEAGNLKKIKRSEEQYFLLLQLYNHNKQKAKAQYAKAPQWAYIQPAVTPQPSFLASFITDIKTLITSVRRTALTTANNS